MALLFTWQVDASELAPRRQQELLTMLQHDCGACHGLRLKGGLGPPLNTDTLKERNTAELINIVTEGRKGTPMPPWKEILNAEEIAWLVDRLRENKQVQRQ